MVTIKHLHKENTVELKISARFLPVWKSKIKFFMYIYFKLLDI